MKTLNDLLPSFSQEPRLVEYQVVLGGIRQLDTPVLSSELKCKVCDGTEHTTARMEVKKNSPFLWLCINRICPACSQKIMLGGMISSTTPNRCVQWPLFCELSGLGDERHNVKFELLWQTQERVDFFKKFLSCPKSFIIMHGVTGKGKTYCALALCELFTRTNSSVVFTTQKKMALKLQGNLSTDNALEKFKTCSLLVIDDFGTAEMTPAFLSFFMELADTRCQWSNRGTVITTNLSPEVLGETCGEALMDRINTGWHIEFKGQTHRKPVII